MNEQPSRNRRLVRRAVWSLVAVVCLIASYLGSYAALSWYIGIETRAGRKLSPQIITVQQHVFGPIFLYESTDWPCARALAAFRIWSLNAGDITWENAMKWSETLHADDPLRR